MIAVLGILLLIIGIIAGNIGMALDPDSDFIPLTFVCCIVFLVFGFILLCLEYA